MVETWTVTLRRQWTDKLKNECLIAVLPSGVHVRPTKSEEEFVLESSNPSDLREAVSKIKRLVIDQLVGSDNGSQAQSNGIDETTLKKVDMNEEMDKEHKKKDVKDILVKEEQLSGVDDKEHDGTRSGTAEDKSRKTADDRKKTSQKNMTMKSLQEKHHGSPYDGKRQQRQSATDDSEHGDDFYDDSAPANGGLASAAKSEQKRVSDAHATATGDSGESANDSAESRQKEAKQNSLQPGQRRSPPDDEVKRQKQNTFEGDGDDSEKHTVSAKDRDMQYGMRATAEDSEPRENHHTAHASERSDQDNTAETNVTRNDDVSAASDDRQHEQYHMDEPLWAYIQFIHPELKWNKKLSVSQDTKQGSDNVELTGSSTDINELKNLCETNRFSRAVVRKLQRMPDRRTTDDFRRHILELSDTKVLIRPIVDDPHFCELVGKRSDINKLEKAISSHYPELVDKKQITDIQKPTSTGPTSVTHPASATSSSAAASTFSYAAAAASGNNLSRGVDQMPARMREQPSEAGLDFQTALSQTSVRIVTGDLLKWRCEVLVDSCDSLLTHLGGISLLFAKAAGRKMQEECNAYKRQRGALPHCGVMDTTAGNIQSPVRRLIHACSPNGRLCRNWNELSPMLEQTFLNCLMCANDKLHARSIALPAISSGASSLT